jgi:hypothetical protein
MGLFAIRDIAVSKVVAFYNGLILDDVQSKIQFNNCVKKSGARRELCTKYRVSN